MPIKRKAGQVQGRPSARQTAFPYVSSHFYHIRSLRERGHRLPYRFRLYGYLTDSVCTATLPIPLIQLPTCRPASAGAAARERSGF
ncbi:hypothetical protein [Methanimicrococcus hacksteinii]|uniref:hypothetical protein n=1 Tax=Methanimicrococcus hacksteinii TaxID=3028293 RepID=UPI00298F2F7B|nr:hypothetical protein [Methanimicrococcus sp. At1]